MWFRGQICRLCVVISVFLNVMYSHDFAVIFFKCMELQSLYHFFWFWKLSLDIFSYLFSMAGVTREMRLPILILRKGKFLVHQAISSHAQVLCKSTIEHLFFQQEITETTFVSVEFLIYTII